MKKTQSLVAAVDRDIYTAEAKRGAQMAAKYGMKVRAALAALKKMSLDALAKKFGIDAKRLQALAEDGAPTQEEMKKLDAADISLDDVDADDGDDVATDDVDADDVDADDADLPVGILTREELQVCDLAGVDPNAMAQFRKDEKEGKTAKLIMASTVGEQ